LQNNVSYIYDFLEGIQKEYKLVSANLVVNLADWDNISLFKDFIFNAFSGFKGVLLTVTKEKATSLTLADPKVFNDFVKVNFDIVRIICFDDVKNITYQYKRSFELLVDLIVMFKISKTSKVKSKNIKRTTILLVKKFII